MWYMAFVVWCSLSILWGPSVLCPHWHLLRHHCPCPGQLSWLLLPPTKRIKSQPLFSFPLGSMEVPLWLPIHAVTWRILGGFLYSPARLGIPQIHFSTILPPSWDSTLEVGNRSPFLPSHWFHQWVLLPCTWDTKSHLQESLNKYTVVLIF